MLEIVKLKGKAPLLLEVSVPPLCYPYLVGNPKGEGLLTWAEKPSPKDTVFTWGVQASLEQIFSEMIRLSLVRSDHEAWGIRQESFEMAEKRLHSLGITELEVSDKVIHPKDPSLLGTILMVENKCFPVIHNVSRGLCVLK